MLDMDSFIERIANVAFFAEMGRPGDSVADVVYVENVQRVFIDPVESDFQGLYKYLEWLPTTSTQEDPFNTFPKAPKDLVDIRLRISKAVMQAIKRVPKDKFVFGAHDFSVAARNAACFAFRQYASECYYESGKVWSKIVDIYLSGRWPVGYAEGKIIVI